MLHAISKSPVVVEEIEGLLCVRLHDYGDADSLEDRLIEDYDVETVWRRIEKEGEEGESFVLMFPDLKSRADLQTLIDKIT
jgi:hypothetical protein